LKYTVQIVNKFHAPDLHHVAGEALLENHLGHIASAITQINGSQDFAIYISHNLHLHDFVLIGGKCQWSRPDDHSTCHQGGEADHGAFEEGPTAQRLEDVQHVVVWRVHPPLFLSAQPLKYTVQIVKKFHAPDLHHVLGVTLLENYLGHIASAITQINGSQDFAICISHNLHLHDFP
jgi:hypothetical protein